MTSGKRHSRRLRKTTLVNVYANAEIDLKKSDGLSVNIVVVSMQNVALKKINATMEFIKIWRKYMNANQQQQGDVIFKKVGVIPLGAIQIGRKNNAIVLAEGEHTGHAHRIFDVDAMFFEKDGNFYLKNEKPVKLTHEEHHEQVIEPGIWQVAQVREKDWLSGMIRAVVD